VTDPKCSQTLSRDCEVARDWPQLAEQADTEPRIQAPQTVVNSQRSQVLQKRAVLCNTVSPPLDTPTHPNRLDWSEASSLSFLRHRRRTLAGPREGNGQALL
jgi:hypothetical protein